MVRDSLILLCRVVGICDQSSRKDAPKSEGGWGGGGGAVYPLWYSVGLSLVIADHPR